jgi:hypothetical protein
MDSKVLANILFKPAVACIPLPTWEGIECELIGANVTFKLSLVAPFERTITS